MTNILISKKLKSILLVTILTMLGTQNVLAQSGQLKGVLITCSQLTDSLARLTCFDTAVAKHLTVSPNTAETKTAATKNIAVTESKTSRTVTDEEVDAFAKEHVKKTVEEKAEEITSITLIISSLNKNAYGQWKISFKNGQKWQQTDSVKLKLKVDQRVVLTKGMLTAVYLQKENTNKRIKVKRVK